MMVKELGEEERWNSKGWRGQMKWLDLICNLCSWRCTPKSRGISTGGFGLVWFGVVFVFSGRREVEEEKYFRETRYFSLSWVGIKDILISLFTQNVLFNENFQPLSGDQFFCILLKWPHHQFRGLRICFQMWCSLGLRAQCMFLSLWKTKAWK